MVNCGTFGNGLKLIQKNGLNLSMEMSVVDLRWNFEPPPLPHF